MSERARQWTFSFSYKDSAGDGWSVTRTMDAVDWPWAIEAFLGEVQGRAVTADPKRHEAAMGRVAQWLELAAMDKGDMDPATTRLAIQNAKDELERITSGNR